MNILGSYCNNSRYHYVCRRNDAESGKQQSHQTKKHAANDEPKESLFHHGFPLQSNVDRNLRFRNGIVVRHDTEIFVDFLAHLPDL